MLHACFVRSPFPRARIRGIDPARSAGAPRRARGVRRRRPQPRRARAVVHDARPDMPRRPLPPLADGEARFVGDPVALVVAESRYVAEDAAELVVVDYEPLTAGRRLRRRRATPRARPRRATRTTSSARWRGPPSPAVDEAFAAAAHVVEETISAAGVRRGPDGDPRHRRGVDGRERRAHDLGRDPGAARGARCTAPACSGCPSTASA